MDSSKTICPTCHGTGVVDAVERIAYAACDSTGKILGALCECCHGTGEVLVTLKAYCPMCCGEI